MNVLLLLAAFSPAFTYSPRFTPGYSVQSGLGTAVCALQH